MRIGTVIFVSIWTACLTCHAQSVAADPNDDLFAKPKGVVHFYNGRGTAE